MTAENLKSANISELRCIAKCAVDFPLNGTLMEWATVTLFEAQRSVDVQIYAYEWKQALHFVKELLNAQLSSQLLGAWRVTDLGKTWFLQQQWTTLPALVNDFLRLSQAAQSHLTAQPKALFFNGTLAFACHYVKHGHPANFSVISLCLNRPLSRKEKTNRPVALFNIFSQMKQFRNLKF